MSPSRKTRRDPAHAPADGYAMSFLYRLWAGDYLTVVDDTIRMVNVADPFDRIIIPGRYLDELEERGWIHAPRDDGLTLVTSAGEDALRAWLRKRHPNCRAVVNLAGRRLELRR